VNFYWWDIVHKVWGTATSELVCACMANLAVKMTK
jgi:hypothetical protein